MSAPIDPVGLEVGDSREPNLSVPVPGMRRYPPRSGQGDGAGGDGSGSPLKVPRRRRAGRALVVVLVALIAAVVAVVVVVKPFGGSRSSGGVADNGTPVSLATVTRRSLSSQQSENGTLGYAGSYTVVNQARGTVTSLPSVGQVIDPGQVLYEVSGEPVVLLYGHTPAYRPLQRGLSGEDVKELNSDLVALGYATDEEIESSSDYFGAETESAVKRLQAKLGVKETGSLALGQAVFLAGPLRITSVSATLGATAMPGPIAQATSTARQVVVHLDAAEQAGIKEGDRVTITLPNNQTTPGVVSSVGKVARSSSSGQHGEEEGAPTIEVDIAPTESGATGTLDQAPVKVSITTASVPNALVVPVTALLALAEGGYAVEVAEGRVHRLVPVTLGLFDNAAGLVQVSGSGLSAGAQVVVPST